MTTHLITGGAAGIGAALVDRLYARGDALYLLVRNERRAQEVRERWSGTHTLVADLEAPEAVEEALAGGLPQRLHSVVHCAGVSGHGAVAELPPDTWQRALTVNVTAPAELTRLALPALRAAHGTVVFMNSGSGLHTGPGWGPYSASKFALRAVANAVRAEETARGVRVTTVYPGRTATGMQEELHRWEGREYDPAQFIQPETVADTVLTALDLPQDAEITELMVRPPGR